MKKYIKVIVFFMFIMSSVITTYAKNDGKPKSNPYEESGYQESYDVEYYDCLVPYTLTYSDIGGQSAGIGETLNSSYPATPMANPNVVIGSKWIRENCHSSNTLRNTILGKNKASKYGVKIVDDEIGMCKVIDKNGAEYYIGAIGPWCLKCDENREGVDKGFGLITEAQIFDVILTDGTCIHFVKGDAIGIAHTNGNDHKNTPVQYIQDKVKYSLAPLNYKQYAYMFQAHDGQFVEIWANRNSSVAEFKKKYNLGNSADSVQIDTIRMYNATLLDPPKRLNGNEVSVKVKNLKGNTSNGNGFSVSTMVTDENQLVGMPENNSLKDKQGVISYISRDDLNISESHEVVNIKENIELMREVNIVDTVRRIIIFIGLLLMVYAMELLVCILVDSLNNWVDISFVKIITFGLVALQIEEPRNLALKGYITRKKLIIVSVVVFIIGVFILSGGVSKTISKILYTFSKKFL